MTGRLQDKVAIITGSAAGQGRAAAELFAAEGAVVVVSDINDADGQDVAASIVASGGRAVYQRADVTDEALVEALIASAVDEFGRLDIMYNNAGAVRMCPIGDLSTEDWRFTLSHELDQVYFCCKYALRVMERQGSGAILNTASTSGIVGIPQHGPHAASKAGVIGLSRSIAVDYGPKGIRCNAIAPGFVPFTHQTQALSNDDFIGMMLSVQALKRSGTPQDVAQAALFLCSDEASWVTGQVLAVDGGHTAM